jgi:hypothetical protein
MADDLSLLQEIDESLRVEKLQQFWKRFGNLVVAGCIGIVLFTIASVLWKNHLHTMHMQQTSALLQADALMQSGKYDKVATILGDAAHGTGDIAGFARLRIAEALLKNGKLDKAQKVYAAMADGERGTDAALSDFAALQNIILADNRHTAVAATQAANEGRPFAGMVQEIKAAQLLNSGKPKEADILLQAIAGDETEPVSERARAMELLDVTGESNP